MNHSKTNKTIYWLCLIFLIAACTLQVEEKKTKVAVFENYQNWNQTIKYAKVDSNHYQFMFRGERYKLNHELAYLAATYLLNDIGYEFDVDTLIYEFDVFYSDSIFNFQKKVVKEEYMQLVNVIREEAEFGIWTDTVLGKMNEYEYYAVNVAFVNTDIEYSDRDQKSQYTRIRMLFDFVIKCYDNSYKKFHRNTYRYNSAIILSKLYKLRCEAENKEERNDNTIMINASVKLHKILADQTKKELEEFLIELEELSCN